MAKGLRKLRRIHFKAGATRHLLAVVLCLYAGHIQGQRKELTNQLNPYFRQYMSQGGYHAEHCKVTGIERNNDTRTITIHLNEVLTTWPVTDRLIRQLTQDVRAMLPRDIKDYDINFTSNTHNLRELITPASEPEGDHTGRVWPAHTEQPEAWVRQQDLPYSTAKGLKDCHIALWGGHGKYYRNHSGTWKHARPTLFTTIEDMLTQTIATAWVMPMLESAGAIVVSPRERDSNPRMCVADNDGSTPGTRYQETVGKHRWETAETGFGWNGELLTDSMNPFCNGTARHIPCVLSGTQVSTAQWIPAIDSAGHYAVYVSYQPDERNATDARYVVRHKGVETSFRVNQQMGGGTWVYLGTFDFGAHNPTQNMVYLTNLSEHRGAQVSADAVRFGGGMGLVARGAADSLLTSGVSRFVEGARYHAQWSGMPYRMYSPSQGQNDYTDDVNCRSIMLNHLAKGSCYLPSDSGLHVPIELSVALHTDAGRMPEQQMVGHLGIYTTAEQEQVYPSGLSRMSSRDLCDMILTQMDDDIRTLHMPWRRRQMFDRNYSETRRPLVPSVIIEMCSHQNPSDLRLALDPSFRFTLARAIYKGILKYVAHMHQREYVVQPLPVERFVATGHPEQRSIVLSWKGQEDQMEPTAKPQGYVVYTRMGDGGYDNGTYTAHNHLSVPAQPGVMYTFKVVAVNQGGRSMPSPELAARIQPKARQTILIADGYSRLAGPQPTQYEGENTGFDLQADFGSPYMAYTELCGIQHTTGLLNSHLPTDTLGYSGTELLGTVVAGNTRDHAVLHAQAIAASTNYPFDSATRAALEAGDVSPDRYAAIDLILGLQKADGYSLTQAPAFTPALCTQLKQYARAGAGILVSGAYLCDDAARSSLATPTQLLHIGSYAPVAHSTHTATATGMGLTAPLLTAPSARHYAAPQTEAIYPTAPAFSAMAYGENNYSAAVAYAGQDYRCLTLGFPFGCIDSSELRARMMGAMLRFVLPH